MPSLYNADLKPIASGATTHPYDHATKLFLADNYRLAPKQSFLFYVVINVNTTAFDSISSALKSLIAPDSISSQTLIEQYENGMLAKRVDLPKFTMATKTLNAYNRKNVVQTSLNYDPINIAFHDDAADLITTFWNDYYTFYYRDSDYPASNLQPDIYRTAHKQSGVYDLRQKTGWGFNPRNLTLDPFLKSISIFSLHNKRFTEYVLINPIITSWKHGNHDSYQGDGIMEHTMTLNYETVKYRTGYVNAVDVNGFGVLHYDNVQSPISTSTTNIYSESGILGAITNGSKDLSRPDGNTGGAGVLGNILNMYKLYNQSKGVNLSGVIKPVLGQYAGKIVGTVLNSALNAIFVPTNNSTLGSSQVYGGTGALTNINPYATNSSFGGVTIGGTAAGIITGAATSATAGLLDTYIRSGGQGQLPQPTIFQVQSTSGVIQVNAQGQPVTGQTTAFIQTADGTETVSSFQTVATSSRTYNPNNLSENLKYITPSVDESGNNVTEYEYLDGTRVIYNSDKGQVMQVYPGANSTGAINAPQNTRDQIASGQNIPPNQVQTYTDPRTGIVYTTGGTVGAYVTNTLSGVSGAVAGATVGQGLNQALNKTFLGKSVIGQTVSGALSGAVGIVAGRAVNNGLQQILNPVTGSVNQAIDNVTGSIKNVVGSWTGTGGPVANSPTQNIEQVSAVNPETGEVYYTYKNQGTAVTATNPETGETYTTVVDAGPDAGSEWYSNGAVPPGVNSDSTATNQTVFADYDQGINSGYGDTWPEQNTWSDSGSFDNSWAGVNDNSFDVSFNDSWDSDFDFSDPFSGDFFS